MKDKISILKLIYIVGFSCFWFYNVIRARAYPMAFLGTLVLLVILKSSSAIKIIFRQRVPKEAEERQPHEEAHKEKPVLWEGKRMDLPKSADDWVADFERRLKKTTAQKAEAKKAELQAKMDMRVNPKRSDVQRVLSDDKVVHDNKERIRYDSAVHVDDEELHDSKGKIHYEKENFQHDKGKVFYDPRGDYSYDEERMNAEAAAFSAQHRARGGEQKSLRVKLKHAALVNGFIMSEVLGKPKALQ